MIKGSPKKQRSIPSNVTMLDADYSGSPKSNFHMVTCSAVVYIVLVVLVVSACSTSSTCSACSIR